LKKIILILLAILLVIFTASAEDIEVSHQLLTKEVYPGESASINIIVRNNQDADDFFKVEPDTLGLYPFLSFSAFKDVYPQSGRRKTIISHQEEVFPFDIYVRDDIEPDRRYDMNFKIRSGTDEEIKLKYPVTIDVVSPEELVKITTDMPDKIAPGKEVVFSVTFRNQANMIVDPADFYIDSDLFSKHYTEKLYSTPYEVKKSLKFTPDPTAKAGTYQLIITAFKRKTLRGRLVKNFEVIANPDVESKVETKSGFLTRTITVTQANKGNVDVDETYELPMTWFQRIMTSFSHEPQKIASGNVEWFFMIKPGSTETLVIDTDYRALFYTLVGIFLATIAIIYYIRRGVSIKKGIFRLKDEKGAITELKVMLHITNRTSKPIKDVKVVEILPNMLTLEKEFGTLKPSKVQKGEKSSRLIWNIDELEPREERIISYKAKPSLHIIGKIVLPAALLRYRSKERKVIDVKSNRVMLFSETAKKKEKEQ